MKNLLPILAFALLSLLSCQIDGSKTPDFIYMSGKMGKKLQSSIYIEEIGPNRSGYFLNSESGEKILLRGVADNDTLVLNEYNNHDTDEITGTFEGIFNGTEYIGHWHDPYRKKEIPFTYSVAEKTAGFDIEKDTQNRLAQIRRMDVAYFRWGDSLVKEGDYLHEKDCTRYDAWWAGKDVFADTSTYACGGSSFASDYILARYGDINQDGQLDGYVSFFPICCAWLTGTSARFVSVHLFLISKSGGGYEVLDEPEVIYKNLNHPVTFHVDKILDDGTVIYRCYEYDDSDALCCPSIEWTVKFRYKNGQFVPI